jgi:hypothetical protein
MVVASAHPHRYIAAAAGPAKGATPFLAELRQVFLEFFLERLPQVVCFFTEHPAEAQ